MTDENTNKDMMSIPYFVHEGMVERLVRILKIVAITLVISIILLFASNVMWAYYWYQFDTTTEEITMEADDGDANYIGHNGDISYGEDKD